VVSKPGLTGTLSYNSKEPTNMRIDTEDHEVLELSVSQVRSWIDGKERQTQDDLEAALDQAQGDILTGKEDEVFIIIHVRP
jgi:hypothetical protein